MPQFLSLEAQSLLRMLFKRNPANRLGKPPAFAPERLLVEGLRELVEPLVLQRSLLLKLVAFLASA